MNTLAQIETTTVEDTWVEMLGSLLRSQRGKSLQKELHVLAESYLYFRHGIEPFTPVTAREFLARKRAAKLSPEERSYAAGVKVRSLSPAIPEAIQRRITAMPTRPSVDDRHEIFLGERSVKLDHLEALRRRIDRHEFSLRQARLGRVLEQPYRLLRAGVDNVTDAEIEAASQRIEEAVVTSQVAPPW